MSSPPVKIVRRVYSFATSSTDVTTKYMGLVARWKRNISRLYARRLLEIATASAATQRMKADLEATVAKPSEWQNWQAADWEEVSLLKSS